jgi:PHD/YefM family antitoxin component YafN of YafNO toxin-antitoxin module
MSEIQLVDARARLSDIRRDLEKHPGKVIRITHRGKPAMALVSSEFLDTLIETLEVMSDPKLMASLRESLKAIQAGKVLALDEVAARYGLNR